MNVRRRARERAWESELGTGTWGSETPSGQNRHGTVTQTGKGTESVTPKLC